MLKATLHNGAIVPLEPLPPEWEEGVALEVAKADDDALDIDAWAKSMERLCADSSAEEEEQMQEAVTDHRRLAKAQSRRDAPLRVAANR